MAVYFFDSSGIVKRYVEEKGTSWVLDISDPIVGNHIYLARIAGVEVISALTRQKASGNLPEPTATTAIVQFRHDLTHQYRLIEITAILVERAMTLAEAHSLRGYDAVQLAAALEVHRCCLALGMPALTLISADTALNTAALAEGLLVEDPNDKVVAGTEEE
ncbi:MAG: type II toxin-antitoxin system VapC family toxin [Candidatus Latescibacteria bacterium]|nr:type II toxin-antitoxin system VapC family toxin [Candidatus Latescibacterota bacterium]